ncbi:DUF998 domain-containing protein [Georgenia thermotolerans]|uniref:DUF998 domain-containing protein n=1 Tax=Georgenia thermotolerans TaxID=527326 RepID=A0A7J5UMT1_9MICO|nr:DUF998 domain-containing protein [Georgenia thermotolerans]KAE8763682.1 DUF998 domain-containing protein [Georgenia thermotolerans]
MADRLTRRLLGAGVAAGPVFVAVTAAQMLTREGFDVLRHPLSLLSRGGAGWVQVTNFVVAGVLVGGFAVGVRRLLRPGPAATAAPVALAVLGGGLVGAGVFVTDPGGLGFPRQDAGTGTTWHGLAHAAATAVGLNAGIVAAVVLARRFARAGAPGWAAYCLATAVPLAVLAWWRGPGLVSVRLAADVVLLAACVSLVAARLYREAAAPPR